MTNAFYNQLIKLPDTVPANFPLLWKPIMKERQNQIYAKLNIFQWDTWHQEPCKSGSTKKQVIKVPFPEINEKVSWHLSSVSDCCKQILVVLVQKPPLFAITIDSNLDLHFHYNYNIWYHGLAYISPQLQQSDQLVLILSVVGQLNHLVWGGRWRHFSEYFQSFVPRWPNSCVSPATQEKAPKCILLVLNVFAEGSH